MRISYLSILFLILFGLTANAQDSLSQFAAPLDIPLYLAGNFAEMRNNHFHTGIDIKTQGVEGQTVRAAADGVISRINVSPWGYGQALYIDHPNGYTTVYGHLSAYAPKIEKAARAEQYAKESFSVDFTPNPPIHVKKGEMIALSGNTGGSGGPHLHFEIRRTETQHPMNPLLFGFKIKDDISPTIRGVRFHPLSDTTLVNKKHEAQSYVVIGSAGKYHLKAGQSIEVYGAFGMSLHAVDFLNDFPNKCGVFRVELNVDNRLICAQEFDSLDFETVRNINSYNDYIVFKNNNWHYHKSYVEPGNQLEIYRPFPKDRGIMDFRDDASHHVVYKATDAYSNVSTLEFDFRSLAKPDAELPTPEPYDAYFSYDQMNHFAYKDELDLTIPKGALYTDLRFQFSWEMKDKNSYSPYYSIQNDDIPLQKAIELKFSWGSIPKSIRSKIVAQRSDIRGRKSYLTGTATEGSFDVTSKEFGKFTLVTDTVAPILHAYKRSDGGFVSDRSVLDFKTSDTQTGIAKFDAYLNGKWVYMAYEYKQSKLWIEVGDSNFQKGDNTLKIIVADGVGNQSEVTYNYKY